jgi:hypothetical protein
VAGCRTGLIAGIGTPPIVVRNIPNPAEQIWFPRTNVESAAHVVPHSQISNLARSTAVVPRRCLQCAPVAGIPATMSEQGIINDNPSPQQQEQQLVVIQIQYCGG